MVATGDVIYTDIQDIRRIAEQVVDSTDGLPVRIESTNGEICEENSTTTILSAGLTFTGVAQDILDWGVVLIQVKSDVASATDGLEVQFSPDNTNWDITDCYTIPAATGKTFSFQPAGRYFRVRYTNGGTDQTYFRLQTIKKQAYIKPSSHRIQDSIIDDDDAELTKAVLTGKNPAGTFVNFQATAAGNFKISLEEYEAATNPIRSDLEGVGDITIGTSEVEIAITGTPTNKIRIQADDSNTATIFIGKTGVLSDGTNDFVRLKSGDELIVPYNDATNALYAISTASSQTINVGALL